MAKLNKNDPEAVAAYLASLPPARKKTLEGLRALIQAQGPFHERISYGTTVIFSQGKDLVGFVAQKNHLSFFTMSPGLAKEMNAEISKTHKVSGATIHFSEDHPLPAALVRKIVKARIAQNAKT